MRGGVSLTTPAPRSANVARMTRALVVGPASWNTVVHLGALPPGRTGTVFAHRDARGLGGTSAGKAVTLAALGVEVTLRTLLGPDDEGALVRHALAHPRITLDVGAADRTERHLNLMTDDGGRLSVYLALPAAPSPDPPPALLRLLRSGGVDLALVDLADHARPFLTAARDAGVPVWCDLHDDDGTAEFQRPFAAAADVLVVSEERLAGPRAFLSERVAAGARLAVCTRGVAGAIARDATGWIEVPAVPVTAVDPNGAGDAFVAGLAHATLTGHPTERALAFAAAVAAQGVASPGLGAPGVDIARAWADADRLAVRRV